MKIIMKSDLEHLKPKQKTALGRISFVQTGRFIVTGLSTQDQFPHIP